MSKTKNNKKTLIFFSFTFFVMIGTYNAVVINTESNINGSDVKFVKRLDEVYGVNTSGRQVANSTSWQKIPQNKKNNQMIAALVNDVPSEAKAEDMVPSAAVQEELTLSLVEVINPVKWQQGLAQAQFNGSLTTNDGVIESLNVSLSNEAGLSVSFAEMSGNVFEYDLEGELYSGMMYQVDKNSYMVTLTNGPLEGTRLRFTSSESSDDQTQAEEVLAENNIEVGDFSDEVATNTSHYLNQENMDQQDQQFQQEAIKSQGYNL